MLDEGTATRNAPKIADDLAQIGASLSTSSTMDASCVQAGSLKKNFPQALDLLADVALHPSFPAEDVDRQRASRLANVVQVREDPAQTRVQGGGGRALSAITIRTASPSSGPRPSLKAISRDDMLAFWKENFVPNNAALIVAGDISMAELKPLVDKAFGAWVKGAAREEGPRSAENDGRDDNHRGQAGSAADRASRGGDRRRAVDAGLQRRRSDEHGARRPLLEPHQHEPARGSRLHVRRFVPVRIPPDALARS